MEARKNPKTDAQRDQYLAVCRHTHDNIIFNYGSVENYIVAKNTEINTAESKLQSYYDNPRKGKSRRPAIIAGLENTIFIMKNSLTNALRDLEELDAARATETPQISTETAETINVSAEGENAEKSAEMPQILNCEWHTKESFKKIPNIAKLAKAGIIINGVGCHTEYLDQSHNVLARVDNLSWDMELHTFPYQGSGVFGKTALFECWEEAVIATIDALAEHLQAGTVNEPIKHISEIMETCRTWDDEKRDYTDEYKYYTWLANHIPEHKATYKNTTELILEKVRERISAAATLAAHGVPKCDIEGAVCAVVNRLAKMEDVLQFCNHKEPPQSPENRPTAADVVQMVKTELAKNKAMRTAWHLEFPDGTECDVRHKCTAAGCDFYEYTEVREGEETFKDYKATERDITLYICQLLDLDAPQSPETPQTVEYTTDTLKPRETARKRQNRAIGSTQQNRCSALGANGYAMLDNASATLAAMYVPRECSTADAAYW